MNYLEAKERERLLKKLEPRYHNAELVFIGAPLDINGWHFKPNYYLIAKHAINDERGIHSIIITLDPKELTRNSNALTISAYLLKFSCWWITPKSLNYMERYLKPINSFLYSNSQEVKSEL